MGLLMKNIHMCRQVKRVETQITLDEDLNVPDIRPDVEMIVLSREKITLQNTRSESGKLFVDGYMEVSILYMDDTKMRKLHRIETRLPFDETINMEGLEAGDSIRIRYETEDLNVALINSRKLAVRAIVSFDASAEEIYDLSAAVEAQMQVPVCERKKKLELMQLEVQKKDILRVKEEFLLPSNKPNILEMLWENVQLRNCRILLREGALDVQGNLFLFVLYRAQDETQSLQWIEQGIPFEGTIVCSDCAQHLVPDIEYALSQAELQIKEDSDGELRLLHLEGMMELVIRLYGNEEVEILEDIYSPEKELLPTVCEENYESLVMRNESKCKVSGRIRIQSAKPRILQICHSNAGIRVDNTKITAEGILIEGALPVTILYISSDDSMPFAVLEGNIPFSHLAKVPQIDESCRYTLATNLDQMTATMADSEEIEVRAAVSLQLFIVRPNQQKCICKMEEKEYEIEKLEAVPGITGYIVQGGENLWDIAKQYYLTPQQIMEMNELSTDQLKKGDCLILMKSINTLRHFA